jgi:hypothetical protein
MAERILGEYGVDSQNATFVPTILGKISEGIRNLAGDAAFFLLPPGNKIARELALNPDLKILSLPHAHALASNLGFVRHVTIHKGGFNYLGNVPNQDIDPIAIPVTLIVKKHLKPAIVTILAQSIKAHFHKTTLVSKPGELLTVRDPFITLNIHAESVVTEGLPYVYRALPFSLAALLDHFSLYIGFIIVAASVYSSMRLPSPQIVWREIQLKWYLRKLEQLFKRVVFEKKSMEAEDKLLIEKVKALLNKEEARLRKVAKMIADLDTSASGDQSARPFTKAGVGIL